MTVREDKAAEEGESAWAGEIAPGRAMLRGAAAVPSTPAVVLFCTFIGFGALAHETGFTLGQALFTTATIFALPGQVVLADQLARGAAISTAAFAVMLTAVRLMPMTVALMPEMRGTRARRALEFVACHFIAVTSWIEARRRLPFVPRDLRLPYYIGFGSALCTATLVGTVTGFALAREVPVVIAAALLFLTPVYFILSLVATMQTREDQLAVLLGSALGPLLFLFMPGFDLLATGLIGGTMAYAVGRMARGEGAGGRMPWRRR